MLYQFSMQDNHKSMVRTLFGMVGSDSVPLYIRHSIACNVNFILKSLPFKKMFVGDAIEAHTTLKPVYNILIESFKTSLAENKDVETE